MGVMKRLFGSGQRLVTTGTTAYAPQRGAIITGVKELDAILATMPARLQKKLAADACKKACKDIILPDAKQLVPVDTGALEDSLVVRAAKRSRSKRGSQVGYAVQTKDGFFQGDEFYGGFQEFGWDDHPEGDPFLRPALWSNVGRIRELFLKTLRIFVAQQGVFR